MKRNIIIGCVFVLLLAIYFFQEAGKTEKKEDAGYQQLFLNRFSASDVSKIQFNLPGKTEAEVLIERDSNASEEWKVISKFNAKGKKSVIDLFLQNVLSMAGEERANDPSLLKEFELEEDHCYHLTLSDMSGKELAHILVGKKGETPSFGFIRFKENNKVYMVDKDLRSEFGLYSDRADQTPDQAKWINMSILSLQSDEISKISMTKNGNEIVLEKSYPAGEPKDEKKETKTADGKVKEDSSKWTLVKPSQEKEIPKESVKSLLDSLASLNGANIMDPSNIEPYGLKSPEATLTLTLKQGTIHSLMLGKDNEGKKFYIQKAGDNFVYEIYDYTKENIFKKIEELANP
jgi:hypothetical protein